MNKDDSICQECIVNIHSVCCKRTFISYLASRVPNWSVPISSLRLVNFLCTFSIS